MCSNDESINKDFDVIFKDEEKKEYNNNRKYYRHNRSLDKFHIDITSSTFDIFNTFDLLDLIENVLLHNALKQLKHTDLQIIKLKYIHKFTLYEIAHVLNMNPESVKKKHSRALKRIKEIIKK